MQFKSQQSDENELKLHFSFNRDDLRLEYSLIGVVVHLVDCPTVGEPGGPALPRGVLRVALPPYVELLDIQVRPLETVRISERVLPIAPIQLSRPGRIPEGDDREFPYRRPDEAQLDPKREYPDPRQEDEKMVEAFPAPQYVPPNARLYTAAAHRPHARVLTTSVEGLNPIATLELNPVKLTEDGFLEWTPAIEITVRFQPTEKPVEERRIPEDITSRAQAMRQVALTKLTVANAEMVVDYSDFFPFLALNTDYLIITDNQRWDEKTMAPIAAAGGDLVTSFERLAKWKRQRGLKARVVTISDIVADKYGNFRTGSRDLQEVIRKFLKLAYADWGVAWVLLGGDINIVPVRRVAGGREGHIDRQSTNPPPDNKSYWTGSYLRMHVVNPGGWWGASDKNLLVRPESGLLIPYDAAGTSNSTSRGWYFTTDDSYATRSSTPTEYVRVNGPAGEINADLQFLYTWNIIPTDLYYSSLVGPKYNQPGKHDWDLLDNGVYGQHYVNNELDGINYTPTISLGRAPVNNAAQADVFVDKVIAYEQLEQPDGTQLDASWIRRVVFASENWGGRQWVGPTNNDPPEDNKYHHTAGANHTVIKLKKDPDWDWSLLAYISASDVRLLPYRTDAASVGRGWYFACNHNDLTPCYFTFVLLGGTIVKIPMLSKWIAVYGTSDELAPGGYIFNNTALDGSLADQEKLRLQMKSEMPGFTQVSRLYEDIADMTPSQVAAAPLELIASDRVRDALNAAPHIVSLSGHGNNDGCCKLSRTMADNLTNGYQTFIAYADSCLTNQFDGDSMSEHLLKNSHGGAVAYIGNTRFSWIGAGDDLQRRFFNKWGHLGGNAHIGLLNDTRAEFLNTFYWADSRWVILALNLMGDPEMPLWWKEPLFLRLPELTLVDQLKLKVDLPDPPDPLIDLPYRKVWGITFAHLRQGEKEQVVMADPEGAIEIPLADFNPGEATLTLARAGYRPIVKNVRLKKTGEEGEGCIVIRWLLQIFRRLFNKK